MKKLLTMLISLLMVSAFAQAMNNQNTNQNDIDPMIKENTHKLGQAISKMLFHLFPELLLTNYICRVHYATSNNNLKGLQVVLVNGLCTLVSADKIPTNLKDEFKLAHEELEKHTPQLPQVD